MGDKKPLIPKTDHSFKPNNQVWLFSKFKLQTMLLLTKIPFLLNQYYKEALNKNENRILAQFFSRRFFTDFEGVIDHESDQTIYPETRLHDFGDNDLLTQDVGFIYGYKGRNKGGRKRKKGNSEYLQNIY